MDVRGGVNAEAGVVMGLEVECYVSEDTASNPRRGSDEGLTRNQSGPFTWFVPWEDGQSIVAIDARLGGWDRGWRADAGGCAVLGVWTVQGMCTRTSLTTYAAHQITTRDTSFLFLSFRSG